jgi:hypothetical protein
LAAIPFGGGMCEVKHVKARTILVGELHPHVVNLAKVIADPTYNAMLREHLDYLPVHPDTLRSSQEGCRERESVPNAVMPNLTWAIDYFVASWMARNGVAGTHNEFDAKISVRFDDGGGDSATRFRNATASLLEWGDSMRRCNFLKMDVFELLGKVEDERRYGIYCDPPFPGPGDKYKHRFDETEHRKLAHWLTARQENTIVCRFYDHPLIRELYAGPFWQWEFLEGRRQTNEAGPEVLLHHSRPRELL